MSKTKQELEPNAAIEYFFADVSLSAEGQDIERFTVQVSEQYIQLAECNRGRVMYVGHVESSAAQMLLLALKKLRGHAIDYKT